MQPEMNTLVVHLILISSILITSDPVEMNPQISEVTRTATKKRDLSAITSKIGNDCKFKKVDSGPIIPIISGINFFMLQKDLVEKLQELGLKTTGNIVDLKKRLARARKNQQQVEEQRQKAEAAQRVQERRDAK
jgi:hypothetical protein